MRLVATITRESLPSYRYHVRCVHDNCGQVDSGDCLRHLEDVARAHLRQTGHAAVVIEEDEQPQQ
jgi:hypothetical protein